MYPIRSPNNSLAVIATSPLEVKIGDADISRRIARLEARMNSVSIDGNIEFSAAEIEDD